MIRCTSWINLTTVNFSHSECLESSLANWQFVEDFKLDQELPESVIVQYEAEMPSVEWECCMLEWYDRLATSTKAFIVNYMGHGYMATNTSLRSYPNEKALLNGWENQEILPGQEVTAAKT